MSNINKCVCVPFGFDYNFFSSLNIDPETLFNEYNILKGKFIVGYSGSIGITNGLDAFIDCAKLMIDDEHFGFVTEAKEVYDNALAKQLEN